MRITSVVLSCRHISLQASVKLIIATVNPFCILCIGAKVRETLINCLCGMKRKAHEAQKPIHINRIVEVSSTAERRDSPARAINQCFLAVLY